MRVFDTIKNKAQDIKDNTTWFDKRYSLRFKIANTVLHDDLRTYLVWTHYVACRAHERNRALDKNSNAKEVELYLDRIIKNINALFNA